MNGQHSEIVSTYQNNIQLEVSIIFHYQAFPSIALQNPTWEKTVYKQHKYRKEESQVS